MLLGNVALCFHLNYWLETGLLEATITIFTVARRDIEMLAASCHTMHAIHALYVSIL